MSKIEKEILLDHEYDGIQELDNDLPSWWLNLFYLSIIFTFVYLIHYHVLGTGPSSEKEYLNEMYPGQEISSMDEAKALGYRSPYAPRGGSDLTPYQRMSMNAGAVREVADDEGEQKIVYELSPLEDEAGLAAGKIVYKANCVACHLADGGGLIGPNFTDDYWIHGGDFSTIVNVIVEGVLAKGMISWEKTLSEEQILQVASYILTFQGTTPATPKAPEGELYTK